MLVENSIQFNSIKCNSHPDDQYHITQKSTLYLTFTGPCIVIYSYNKSQQDALFLKFILVKNSTCFGQIYCPSSGVSTLYRQTSLAVNITSMTNTYCCVYSVETPDDGQQICPKHVEFFTKINLRNSASSWLLL